MLRNLVVLAIASDPCPMSVDLLHSAVPLGFGTVACRTRFSVGYNHHDTEDVTAPSRADQGIPEKSLTGVVKYDNMILELR